MKKLDDSYALYIVKKNDGATIRLANFFDLLRDLEDKREILLVGLPDDELSNPLWQTRKMIWFSITNPVWMEATQDDDLAKQQYREALELIKNSKDLDPTEGDVGTLVVLEFPGGKGKFSILEGQNRQEILRQYKKGTN